jgi:hypothetical protein
MPPTGGAHGLFRQHSNLNLLSLSVSLPLYKGGRSSPPPKCVYGSGIDDLSLFLGSAVSLNL